MLDWRLRVEVMVGWGRNLELTVPLTMVRGEVPKTPARVPAVGVARAQALWAEVAERHVLQYAEGRLSKREADWSLVVHQELRHGERFLIAELLPPEPLGIGLVAEPALLGRFSGLSLGLADFDAAHRVQGHDQTQLMRLLAYWVEKWPSTMRLEANDHGLRVLTPRGGYQRESLEALVHVGLMGLRELPVRYAKLPLPERLEVTEPFWSELATRIEQSRLSRGPARLKGRWAGRAVRIDVVWQQGDAVGLGLGLEGKLSSRVCRPQPLAAADVASLGELSASSRTLVAKLLVGERRLLLEARGATLLLPGRFVAQIETTSVAEQVALVHAALGELTALLDDLAGRGGPYR